jgi:hypothetical protein
MYPWLFECWDCGQVEEDDVDDETIAVRSNGKKRYNQPRGRRGGGRRDTAASKVRGRTGGAEIAIAALRGGAEDER